MKAFLLGLLCAAGGAALALSSCANQNTAANNPNGMSQHGAVNSGSHIGGGGSGIPGRTRLRNQP